MFRPARCCHVAFWVLLVALFAGAGAMLAWFTPVQAELGPVQRIFYLHLPSAFAMFGAALIVCVAGVGYLWQRRPEWDDLGIAAAKVTVLYCAVVLATGMIWARSEWGHWWLWTPRLTFSLVLLVLYVAYVVLRRTITSPERRAMVCAVYGTAAFLDVPLVYLSVRLLPDVHPTSIVLDAAMKLTLAVWFVPVTLLAAGLIALGFRLAALVRKAEESCIAPSESPSKVRTA